MKRVIVTAGEINCGLSFQRGHLFFRQVNRLRPSDRQIEFVCKDFEALTPSDLLYADLVIFMHPYHAHQAQFIHRVKSQYQIPVIVDLDDMLDNLPVDHPEYHTFKNCAVPEIIRSCDHLVTSTEYLRKHWGHLNKNISVIENQIDPRRVEGFEKSAKPYHSGFVIGWTGSQTHRPDLYNTGFIRGLRKFMRERDDVRAYFHILCPQTLLDEFGCRIIFNEQAVDYLDYPSMCFTYPFDVCAVPLYDHPFNHAKSDLRLLDMGQFRIPVIASNMSDWEKHHERVALCNNTPEDWYEAFKWAYETPKALNEMADKAHDYVMSERVVLKSVEKWETLFRVYLG